jgi:hypothetical protein
MHARPPSRARKRRTVSDHRKPDDERKREADAKRKREQREREDDGITTFPGRASQSFIEAMIARAKFYGASEQEAEAASHDLKQIAALVFAILDDWAGKWYSKK